MDSDALSSELNDDQRWLVRLTRRLLRDPDSAEDIAQEASLRALASPTVQRSESRSQVRAWLRMTARYLAWNANRREQQAWYGRAALAVERRDGAAVSAVERSERAEFRATVATLVAELSASERDAVILHYYEDLQVAAIREAVGAPSDEAVRKRLSRGVQRLRGALDERFGREDWRWAAVAATSAVRAKTGAFGPIALAALSLGCLGALVWVGASNGDEEGPHGSDASRLVAANLARAEAPLGSPGVDPGTRRAAGAGPAEGKELRTAKADDAAALPGATIHGQVSSSGGEPVEGAWVFTDFGDGNRVLMGRMTQLDRVGRPWSDPEFELGQGEAVTDAEGRFSVFVRTASEGRSRASVTALSPGGDAGFELLKGLIAGDQVEDLRFVLRDEETLTLYLRRGLDALPAFDLEDAAAPEALVLWDQLDGPERTFMAGSSVATPLLPTLEAGDEGPCLRIARFHQPPRDIVSESLQGMLFLAGCRPARFVVDAGSSVAEIELDAAPPLHLKLDLLGTGVSPTSEAIVILTPEPPDPDVSALQNDRRVRSMRAGRQRFRAWKNGERRVVPGVLNAPLYAYVSVPSSGERAVVYAQAFGPLHAHKSTREAPHVLRVDVDQEFVSDDEAAHGDEGSEVASQLAAGAPATVRATIVSSVDGAVLPHASLAVHVGPSQHGASHSHTAHSKRDHGSVSLQVAAREATLDAMAPGHAFRRLDPIGLLPGEVRDLGEIELDPLRKMVCQFEHVSGGTLRTAYEVTVVDAAGVTRRSQADLTGRVEIPYAVERPKTVAIRLESGTSAPKAIVPVSVQPDGTGRIVVPEWETLAVHVSGIPAPQRYLFDRLNVRAEGLEAERPSTSYWPGFRGDDLVFQLQLPPGKWMISSGRPGLVRFDPRSMEILEGSGPAAQRVLHLRAER